MAKPEGEPRYLEKLTQALRVVRSQSPAFGTRDFTLLCDQILHLMDFLGPVMYFAKYEMSGKNDSLKSAAEKLQTLSAVVAADKEAGRLTTKGSCARNLHRLMCVILFVKLVFVNLLKDANMQLKDAIWAAYEGSLAPIHTYMVKTAVWAGLYALPSKETFMKSIGETFESAKEHATEFIDGSDIVVREIESLFGVSMPASDVSYIPLTPPAAAST